MDLAQRKEKKAARRMAKGVTRSALLNPHMSERRPRRVGEIASPRAWMKKMFTANAVARARGRVTLTMMVLSGPVLRKRKNSASNIVVMQPGSEGVERA